MPVATPDRLTQQQAAETQTRSIYDKRNAASADVKVEAVRLKAVEAMKKARDEGREPGDEFQEMRQEAQKIDKDKGEKAINDTIDVTLDVVYDSSTTPPKESKGQDRKTKAEEGRTRLEKFLEKDGFNNHPSIKGEIRGQIESVIVSEPWGQELMAEVVSGGATPAEKDRLRVDFLDKWATDKDFRQQVYDKGKALIERPPDVTALQQRIDAAKQAREARQLEVDNAGNAKLKNTADQADAKKALTEFGQDKTDPSTGVVTDSDQKKMDALQTDIKAHATSYSNDLRELAPILARFQGKWVNGGIDMDPRKLAHLGTQPEWARVKTLTKKLALYEQKQKDFSDLEAKKTQLETNLSTLQTHRDNLDREFERKQEELAASSSDLTLAEIARAEAEDAYVKDLTNVFKDAMRAHADIELQNFDEAVASRLQTEAADENDPLTKGLKTGIANRWENKVYNKKTGKLEKVEDKNQVKEDMALLISDDLNEIARCIINPNTGTFYSQTEIDAAVVADPNFLNQFINKAPDAIMIRTMLHNGGRNDETGQPWTTQEIAAKLVKDPEFFKRERGNVINQIVKKAIMTKQLKQEDFDKILANNDWGGEELLTNIYEDEDVKKRLDKAGVSRETWNFLTKKHKKATLWILLALIAPGFAGIAGVGMLTASALKTLKGGPVAGGEHG